MGSTDRNTRAQVVRSVGDTAQSVAQSLDAADATNLFGAAHHEGQQADASMRLNESTELSSYGAPVNGDTTAVDKFAQETGGIASVCQKRQRLCHHHYFHQNAQGERQMGVALEHSSPAACRRKRASPYAGRTVVDGKPYMRC